MNRSNNQNKPKRKPQKRLPTELDTNNSNVTGNENHPFNKADKRKTVENKKNGEGQNGENNVRFYEKGQFWINIALLLISGVSLWFSDKANKQSLDLESRPIITFTDIHVDSVAPQQLKIAFHINNIGKLPAIILKGSVGIGLVSGSIDSVNTKDTSIFHPFTTQNATIGNGIYMPFEEYIMVKQDVWDGLKSNKINMYMVGEIEYRNIITDEKYKQNTIERIVVFPHNMITVLKDTIQQI